MVPDIRSSGLERSSLDSLAKGGRGVYSGKAWRESVSVRERESMTVCLICRPREGLLGLLENTTTRVLPGGRLGDGGDVYA